MKNGSPSPKKADPAHKKIIDPIDDSLKYRKEKGRSVTAKIPGNKKPQIVVFKLRQIYNNPITNEALSIDFEGGE